MADFKKDILDKYFSNKNITDISFNGKDVYVQDNTKGRYKINEKVNPEDVEKYNQFKGASHEKVELIKFKLCTFISKIKNKL